MPLLTDFIPQATIIPLNGNLGIGTNVPNERLTVNGNISATGLVLATSTRAGNLTGGSAGQVPYQIAPNITLFTAAGTSGQVLQSTGTTAPIWLSQSSIVAGSATVLATSRTLWGQSFNGSANVTGNINVGGNVTNIGNIVLGNSADPNKATVQYNGTAARTFTITDVGANADFVMTQGTQSIAGAKTFSNIVNATTTLAGNLTGGGAGRIPYQSGADITLFTIAGTNGQLLRSNGTSAPDWVSPATLSVNNATTAGTLGTSRSIWGQSFNGSADITGNISNIGTGTNKATIDTAVLAAARIYTLPDAGANASFVMTAGDQTIAGTKTYSGKIAFGSTTRQMIDLWGSSGEYGIGIGSSTTYFRSNSRFSWYRAGIHSNTENDPGTGGVVAMTLDGSSDLTLGRNLLLGTQTNKATLTYTTNTARTYTIPDAGANADFVMNQGNQTIAGTKTFSSTIAGSVNGTAAGIAGGAQYNIPIQNAAGSTIFIANGTTNQILTYTASGPAWQTPTLGIPTITTTNTNLVNGQVLGVNTTSGAVSVTLPASPSVGNRVEIFDSHRRWNTFNCTILRNNQNIDGLAENLVCDVAGSYISLIYVDATEGWAFFNTNS